MDTPLFVFKKPVHSRITDASGAQRIVYTFPVEMDSTQEICGVYDADEHGSSQRFLLSLLVEEREWLLRFVEAFLTATKPYFVKPYSPSAILRYLTHRVTSAEDLQGPLAYIPTAVVIIQGQFVINWAVRLDSIDIQIPDDEDAPVIASAVAPATVPVVAPATVPVAAPATVPVAAPVVASASVNLVVVPSPVVPVGTDSLAAVDTDALPYTAASEILDLRTPEQQTQERRRVREVHLRAKLAQYKAERTLTKYIEKYGDDLSYSSESEWDTEGEEEDGEGDGEGERSE